MGIRSNPELGKKHYRCHECKKGSMEREGRRYYCLNCPAVVLLYPYNLYKPRECKECGSTDIQTRTTGKDFESYQCGSCDTMIVTDMTHRI